MHSITDLGLLRLTNQNQAFSESLVISNSAFDFSLTALCKAVTNPGYFPQLLTEVERSCVLKVCVRWGRTLLLNVAYRDADKRFECQTWKEMSYPDRLSKVWALGQTCIARYVSPYPTVIFAVKWRSRLSRTFNLSIKIFIVVSVSFHRFRVRAGNIIIFPGISTEELDLHLQT